MGHCKTCIYTDVCIRDKNLFGDIYVAPNPWFFDEEYRKKSWENYLKRKEQGFPCDKFLEIIRCKDCQHFKKAFGWNALEYTECDHFDCDVAEDGFCSWGERRENEAD